MSFFPTGIALTSAKGASVFPVAEGPNLGRTDEFRSDVSPGDRPGGDRRNLDRP